MIWLFVAMTAAARAATCAELMSPLESFYQLVEAQRAEGAPLRHELYRFLYGAEVLEPLGYLERSAFGDELLKVKNSGRSAREILHRLLKRRRLVSVAKFERAHEARRVVELRLIPELVDDVLEGQKTSSVRAWSPRELKSGPGVFRVYESGLRVPITIASVTFGRTLDRLTDADLRAQGPFVRDLLEREGREAAIEAIREGMSRHYPGFARGDDVTVVHFRRLAQ